MFLPVRPKVNYSLTANVAALLCNSGRYYASLKAAQQGPVSGWLFFASSPVWRGDWPCGFCCTNGEETSIHSYSPQQMLCKNETTGRIERETSVHFNVVPGFGSL